MCVSSDLFYEAPLTFSNVIFHDSLNNNKTNLIWFCAVILCKRRLTIIVISVLSVVLFAIVALIVMLMGKLNSTRKKEIQYVFLFKKENWKILGKTKYSRPTFFQKRQEANTISNFETRMQNFHSALDTLPFCYVFSMVTFS